MEEDAAEYMKCTGCGRQLDIETFDCLYGQVVSGTYLYCRECTEWYVCCFTDKPPDQTQQLMWQGKILDDKKSQPTAEEDSLMRDPNYTTSSDESEMSSSEEEEETEEETESSQEDSELDDPTYVPEKEGENHSSRSSSDSDSLDVKENPLVWRHMQLDLLRRYDNWTREMRAKLQNHTSGGQPRGFSTRFTQASALLSELQLLAQNQTWIPQEK
jgi:hypothetical protein